MSIDATLIRRKASLILEDLSRLEGLAQLDLSAYLNEPTNELVAERLLERIIGRLIDINFHLWVGAGHQPPRDYHESFLRLAELGILTPEAAREMAKASGLRNRLAHEYNGIDSTRVHEAVRAYVISVPAYLRAVEEHLERTGA
jgi:uncharacterized protein YutE (UPF0331/DUF86 family)